MTDTVTENADVAGYLAAVRAALLDLPASDYDDLIEDLEAHLYEVLAESGGASLEASLGSPTAYAAELRASAGLEPADQSGRPLLLRLEQRLTSSDAWELLGRTVERPAGRAVREFLPTLRPGWWVVRGWLALFAVVGWLHGHQVDPYRRFVVVPTYHGNWPLGALAVLAAVIGSVWLGLRAPALSKVARRMVAASSALILLVAFSLYLDRADLGSGFSYPTYGGVSVATSAAPTAAGGPSGLVLDGHTPLNIYAYDAQGHLLSNVRLYDEQGKPLQGLGSENADGQPLVRVPRQDAAGALVNNEYPQQVGAVNPEQLGTGPDGGPNPVPTSGPSAAAAFGLSTPLPTPTIFVPPMAGAMPTPSAQPTAAATPTPSLTPAARTSVPAKPKAKVKPKPAPKTS